MDLYDELHANHQEYLRLVMPVRWISLAEARKLYPPKDDERSKKGDVTVPGRGEIVAHAGSGSVK